MLPSLEHFAVAIIGAALLIGLFTVITEWKAKEGKPVNPTVRVIVIVVIIMIFAGYLIS